MRGTSGPDPSEGPGADAAAPTRRLDAMRRLAGTVAHQLNNALTVMAGHVGRLDAHVDPGDPARRSVDELQRVTERVTELARQLLAFAGRQPLSPCDVDVNVMLAALEPVARRLLGPRVELSVETAAALPAVHVDPEALERVLMALVANARGALGTGGRLELRSTAAPAAAGERPRVRITVRDTGKGMDTETAAHAFEPFYAHGRGGGEGMGLATAYGFVRQSGGEIALRSEPGVGTTVTIDLPAAAEPEAPPREDTLSGIRRGGLLVLVEDDQSVLWLLREALESEGFAVLPASTPHQAATLCAQHGDGVALLITDLAMPGMDGRQLADEARKSVPGLRVLYISGRADVERLAEGEAFLQKPFPPSVLAREVRRVLAGA